MASAKQIAANRLNGQKSHGPLSDEGKAISSRNSLKHGLTAPEVLLPNEDGEAFAELGEGLRAELDPQGVMESVLVERIIGLYWRLRRLGKIEADIFNCQHHQARVAGGKWKLKEVRSDPDYFKKRSDRMRAAAAIPEIRRLFENKSC